MVWKFAITANVRRLSFVIIYIFVDVVVICTIVIIIDITVAIIIIAIVVVIASPNVKLNPYTYPQEKCVTCCLFSSWGHLRDMWPPSVFAM